MNGVFGVGLCTFVATFVSIQNITAVTDSAYVLSHFYAATCKVERACNHLPKKEYQVAAMIMQ